MLNPMEASLQMLCQLYWGKGDNGRNQIYRSSVAFVPTFTSVPNDSGSVASTDAGPKKIPGEGCVKEADMSGDSDVDGDPKIPKNSGPRGIYCSSEFYQNS
jgi:hypothetical protein